MGIAGLDWYWLAGVVKLPCVRAFITQALPQFSVCRRVLLEKTLSAWLAARPALALPSGQSVGVYVGCMYHEYLSVTAAASGGKPPTQVRGSDAICVQ